MTADLNATSPIHDQEPDFLGFGNAELNGWCESPRLNQNCNRNPSHES
ncbi:hypothetical protein [Pseudomonas tohonis]|nr:hypothetical protein [Pseudomonas tohonis]